MDAAALAQASRAILQNHVALRSQQLNVYARTSSLAATARVQLNAAAANPPALYRDGIQQQFQKKSAIPVAESARGDSAQDAEEQGVGQDHHYDASASNSSVQPKPTDSLPIQQEKGLRHPLPDGTLTGPGTRGHDVPPGPSMGSHNLSAEASRRAQRISERQIPSQVAKGPNLHEQGIEELVINQEKDVFHTPSTTTEPVLSSLPRVKVPRHAGTAQEGKQTVAAQPSNPDVFYNPRSAGSINPDSQKLNVSDTSGAAEESSPREDSQLFQNPRVVRMLHGQGSSKPNPYAANGRARLQDQSWPPKDRSQPVSVEEDDEVKNLAQDISNVASQEVRQYSYFCTASI